MFMLKYFCGYHRPMKINQNEYLTHETFSHENFPTYGTFINLSTDMCLFSQLANPNISYNSPFDSVIIQVI